MYDVRANRQDPSWTKREMIGRVVWSFTYVILFRTSPRPLWGWRRFILRCFGGKIGRGVHVYPNVQIAVPWNLSLQDYCSVGDGVRLYSLGKITLEKRCTVSQGAHLCAGTHNHRARNRPLLKLPITIGEEAWVCADAFIGPSVVVGARAIVGARAVVIRSVEKDTTVVGNPAKPTYAKRESRGDSTS